VPGAAELESTLVRHVVEPWFPRCLDAEHGGFLCDFDRAWRSSGPQDKFLEFQARQTWLAALVSRQYPQDEGLREATNHGLRCLRETMWDSAYGGWFHRADRAGVARDEGRKHAHGSAYAIAACAEASVTLGDPGGLELAQAGFEWLDSNARDGEHGGYFGFLARDGSVIRDEASYSKPRDPIGTPIGLKDANVNSDLIETLSVLVAIEPAELARARLAELVLIVGERLVSPEGTLSFYCRPDWTPLSGTRFGTQLQTAHRLVTAGELLGASNDDVAGPLFRRTLELGWDRGSGGFFFADYGYRPHRREWWVSAECLRALAVLGPLAGDEGGHRTLEERVWSYLSRRLLDERYGGMYTEGIDGLPYRRRALGIRFAPDPAVAKGSIWKDGWHEGKALLVCMDAARRAGSASDGV
jgi:mannobiose 2-epimerase